MFELFWRLGNWNLKVLEAVLRSLLSATRTSEPSLFMSLIFIA